MRAKWDLRYPCSAGERYARAVSFETWYRGYLSSLFGDELKVMEMEGLE